MYEIGKITSTHGIKGEVKIYDLSDFNRFFVGAEIYVITSQNIKKHFIIERVRTQGKFLIVKFKDYDNINDILVFKGLMIYADNIKKEELEEEDYHYDSLLDKEVYTDSNEFIGKVVRVIAVPQGHLLEILKTNEKKVLVPFISVFVSQIFDDKIIVTPIEGLL